MAKIALRGITKSFGAVKVIHGIDLDIAEGEFAVFVGPSGCGKSTLLRLVSGLEEVGGGTVSIGGRDVTRTDPSMRGVAMVFQSYALYPHMSVYDNMAFGLKMTGADKNLVQERVHKAADILELRPLLTRKPKALSGGQRQRVAIGRAIVREPKVFLFDEPLSNLDAELRVQMRLEIAKLHKELGVTMIYVTHDQTEAMTLADKIVVLRGGLVEQVGAPLELYDNPDNEFVAGFIGSPRMNFIQAETVSGAGKSAKVRLPAFGNLEADIAVRERAPEAGEKVKLAIRPEHFAKPQAKHLTLRARADFVERLGGVSYLHLQAEDGTALTVEQKGHADLKAGEIAEIGLDVQKALLFDEHGKRL